VVPFVIPTASKFVGQREVYGVTVPMAFALMSLGDNLDDGSAISSRMMLKSLLMIESVTKRSKSSRASQ
jgi:hypothetical protein